jgi:CHAT domain-containing protein
LLQLHEIYKLKLGGTELAVLSACNTGIGSNVEGEGVFSLTRGFLSAGASRVVASLWAVNDASTATMMEVFFKRILAAERAGEVVDYAGALREAKKRIRDEPGWEHPFFWAPFVLVGPS